MKKFLLALQFLTTIPVKVGNVKDEDLTRSTSFFPIVGIMIGVMLATANYFLLCVMPPILLNAILLILWILITGALHLDGFADTVDGFSAGTEKGKILKVMDDSATGAKGVVAVVMILLFKYSILLSIGGSLKTLALVFAPSISRYSMFIASGISNSAREEGLGKLYIRKMKWVEFIMPTLIILILLGTVFYFPTAKPAAGFIALAVVLVVIYLFVLYCRNRINGMTGDTLGALNEIIEIVVLLVIAIIGFTWR